MLRDQAVDAILTSPLGRARRTAEIIGDQLGLAVRIANELTEIHHGDFAGLTDAEIEARFPGALRERSADKYRWRFPGGESYADADLRAAGFLSGLTARRPLIVAHEMIGRLVQRHLLGLDPASALATAQPNAVIYAIDPLTRTRRDLRPPRSTAAP